MVRKNKTKNQEAAPETQPVITGNNIENQEKVTTYVVVREGFRVSDREYKSLDDPIAISEQEFWTRVANNHSYGESVEIVRYDSRKHRVW